MDDTPLERQEARHGMTFVSYDNLDEMMDDLARAERMANASILPRQARHLAAAIDNPTRWFRMWGDVLIVGESQSIKHQAERELELGGDEEGDYDYQYAKFLERHQRGYLFGPAYSVITPEGELGSTHVSQVVWCDPDVFDVCKQHGWSLERLRNELSHEKLMALAITMDANSRDTYMEADA